MRENLILHRGYKGKYLENSEKAFEEAIKNNLPFETDVRISADGECFLIHDSTIDRLFNGHGKIKEKTSQELKNIHYKQDKTQKLFSLNELCLLIKRHAYQNKLFIHIQDINDIGCVIKILEKNNVKKNIRFFACDELTLNLIKIIKLNYPEYLVGIHFYENCAFAKKELVSADFIWADEVSKRNITLEIVNFSKAIKKPIYAISPELIPESVFNNNVKHRWKELIKLDVDGICTDLPEEFLTFAESKF